MLMCKAAALTKQIRFGHAIRQLPLHHPVDLVQEANMCDQVLEGRFLFGYGGTHLANREQLEARGRDVEGHDDRALVRESIDFILKCWTEKEPFDFEGQFWSGKGVRILPPPYQQPHPPIACACTGSAETIELAARNRFIPLLGRGNDTADAIGKMCEMYIESAAAAGYT